MHGFRRALRRCDHRSHRHAGRGRQSHCHPVLERPRRAGDAIAQQPPHRPIDARCDRRCRHRLGQRRLQRHALGSVDNPCGASNYTATVIRWDEITPACTARVVGEYKQTLDEIFTQIDELRGCWTPKGEPTTCSERGGKDTALRLATVYNDWIGYDDTPTAALAPSELADEMFVDAQCWVVVMHGGPMRRPVPRAERPEGNPGRRSIPRAGSHPPEPEGPSAGRRRAHRAGSLAALRNAALSAPVGVLRRRISANDSNCPGRDREPNQSIPPSRPATVSVPALPSPLDPALNAPYAYTDGSGKRTLGHASVTCLAIVFDHAHPIRVESRPVPGDRDCFHRVGAR